MMSDSLHTEASTAERYWVVGGKYETMEFDRVVPGTEDVFGPFGSIQDAESVWRCVAEKTRYQATIRYTIAAEQTCMPQASRPVIYAAVGEAAPSPTPTGQPQRVSIHVRASELCRFHETDVGV